MLLFADGFETFSPYDLWRKWGSFWWYGATAPVIVHGDDTTYSPAKPYARKPDGRALQGSGYNLGTPIRPSRTVFVGLACRSANAPSYYQIEIQFLKGCKYDKTYYNRYTSPPSSNDPLWFGNPGSSTRVASCFLNIYPSYIDVTWTFTGTSPLTKTGRINSSATLTNGDFRYIQVGMTLGGNVVTKPEAWAEVRLGNRGNNLLQSGIMTAAESGAGASFLINGVTISVQQGRSIGLDDVYICNDEGDYNNTFLGSLHVRRVSVSGDGTDNDSVPFGETYRFRTVDEDFIDTVNSLPVPLPDPVTNPLFIPWEAFAGDYTTLEKHSHRQLMRFTSLNSEGAYPKIYGAVLHALLQPRHLDTPGTIKAVRKFGIEDLIESKVMDAPLIKRTEFEARQFVWENEEMVAEGEPYARWSPAAVDSSEWGFSLVPVTIDPATYDPAVVRVNIVLDEIISEGIDFMEFVERYFQETVDDPIDFAEEVLYA